MRLIRKCRQEVRWIVGKIRPPTSSATLIVKGTYTLEPGKEAVLASNQDLPTGDLFEDDDPQHFLRYASDFAPFKPCGDLLLVGHAYAPRDSIEIRPRIQVGTFSKSILVTGNRVRRQGKISPPQSFRKIALGYDNSYGGVGYARNPVGKGFGQSDELPNLEAPEPPANFGPIPVTWEQRLSKAGTHDRAWLASRWPWLPADADLRIHNAAPADQQLPGYLKGDEPLRFDHLHPECAIYESRLAGHRVRAFFASGGGTQEVSMHLDTLWVNLDVEKLILVWRGVVDLRSDRLRDSDALLIVSESLGAASQPRERFEPLFEERPEENEEEGFPAVPPPAVPPQPNIVDRSWCMAHLDELRGQDLTRADLSGLDLTGADFRDSVLARANLKETCLYGARLCGAVLAEANLQGADLRKSDLTGADLMRANLTRASAKEAVLDSVDLSHATLLYADFRDAQASKANFSDANLRWAKLCRARLTQSDFSRAALHDADLTEADLTEGTIEEVRGIRLRATGANMSGARAAGAWLGESDLRCVEAQESTWSRAKLYRSDLRYANFSRADFEGAYLPESLLSNAILRRARLPGANLRSVEAIRCDLLQATLIRTNLCHADFRESNLFEADLFEADWSYANFQGANVRRTHPRIVCD